MERGPLRPPDAVRHPVVAKDRDAGAPDVSDRGLVVLNLAVAVGGAGAKDFERDAAIEDLVARCLEKDQKRRLRDVGDVFAELDDKASAPPETSAPASRSSITPALWLAALHLLAVGIHGVKGFDTALMPWMYAQAGGKLLAGGQSLLPSMKLRLSAPEQVVDLNRISSLAGIRREGGVETPGPCARPDRATSPALLREEDRPSSGILD